jgi:hypothetical protein
VALPGILLRALASGYVKKNEELTTSGPYAYTRNPLYLGSLIMAVGFAIAARSGTRERALAPRLVGEGDWEAPLDGVDAGAIIRLRFENRGATPLAWWGLRLAGTVAPQPPVLPASLRPPPGPLNVKSVGIEFGVLGPAA